jgi:hypothetical protein
MRDEWTQSGKIAANGTAELVFTPFAGQDWDILSASMDGSIDGATLNVGGAAVGALYKNNVFVSFFIATKDTAEGVTVPLRQGNKFRVRWTNAVVGAPVQATIWYDDGK